ncbi:hypothetical protein GUU_04564 [Malacoplasma iowae 695]|nr:hypothetical protein GUU_04564 [Malacoplasma iowae 695]
MLLNSLSIKNILIYFLMFFLFKTLITIQDNKNHFLYKNLYFFNLVIFHFYINAFYKKF